MNIQFSDDGNNQLKDAVNKTKKGFTVRQTKEYKEKYQLHLQNLKELDKTDGKPGDGRLDISIFCANYTRQKQGEYAPVSTKEVVFDGSKFTYDEIERNSVNIEAQALAMADRDFGI